MKKYIKIGAMIIIVSLLAVAGVFAAATATWKLGTNTISFISVDAKVNINGKFMRNWANEATPYTYFGTTFDVPSGAMKTPETWELGKHAGNSDEKIVFNTGNYAALLELKFTNIDDVNAQIILTPPSAFDAHLSFSGTKKVGDSAATPLATATAEQTIVIEPEGIVTFTYAIVLTDFTQSILDQDFSFVAKISKAT